MIRQSRLARWVHCGTLRRTGDGMGRRRRASGPSRVPRNLVSLRHGVHPLSSNECTYQPKERKKSERRGCRRRDHWRRDSSTLDQNPRNPCIDDLSPHSRLLFQVSTEYQDSLWLVQCTWQVMRVRNRARSWPRDHLNRHT